ncbi:MAG: ABC transporter permease [Chloroflexi bacterium]|nr:ABC transporter permease [Chloroflexota bacterium]MYE39347.1 ABC transporter permease [Chloroflexota bacterium]
MGAYLVRRLATLPLMLLGISAVSFALLNLAPGDPAEIVLRQRNPGQMPSPAAVSAMRVELGLDTPLPAQYVRWISRALTGDMGRSYVTERPVAAQLARRTVPTLLLTAAALGLALLVAVPVGILSARRRGGVVDVIARLAALVGAAAPSYALAFGLIILFAVKLSWLPALGYGSAAQAVLPAIALSLAPMAQLMRLIRASMLEVLGQDYIRTARAKGLSEQTVVIWHALRNALLPAIGATGVNLGYLLSGAVIVETIFTWPGLGQLMVGAALTRDYPVVQGFVTYIAVVVLLANLAADIALRIADPRLRYEREEV